jgi:uncharacterized NAD(P)/FAD-binding protein YdhS
MESSDCVCPSPLTVGSSCPDRADVAIVGGGFSGLLTLLHILQRDPDAEVVVIERTPRPGPGLAYGACAPQHLLNVPADRMGAFPDDPRGFFTWLEAREPGRFQPHEFVPRALYGEYLLATVSATAARHAARVRFVHGVVERLTPLEHATELSLSSGHSLVADEVVLALGLPMAAAPWEASGAPQATDPWSAETWRHVQPTDRVVIVGTGLTGLDVLSSLEARGHRGPVRFVSRNGRFPLPHASTHGAPAVPVRVDTEVLASGPRHAVRLIRALVDEQHAAGGSWHAVLDAVRPHVAATWQRWSAADRQRFLRRLRPLWDVHRHRAPLAVLGLLERGIETGRIETLRGSVERLDGHDGGVTVTVRTPQGDSVSLDADRVFNCIGPTLRLSESRDPLIRSLLDSGLALTDEASLGLSADGQGRLRQANGGAARRIFLLGALRRGDLWESTAVPELRGQAAAVGAGVAEALAGSVRGHRGQLAAQPQSEHALAGSGR